MGGVNFSSLKELPISPINQNYKDASEDNNFLSTPKKFIIKKSTHDNFQDSLKDTRKSTRSKTYSSLPPSKSTFYEMNEKKIKNDHDSKWNFYSKYNMSQSSLKVLPEIKLHKEDANVNVKEESNKLVSLNKDTDKEKKEKCKYSGRGEMPVTKARRPPLPKSVSMRNLGEDYVEVKSQNYLEEIRQMALNTAIDTETAQNKYLQHVSDKSDDETPTPKKLTDTS